MLLGVRGDVQISLVQTSSLEVRVKVQWLQEPTSSYPWPYNSTVYASAGSKQPAAAS